MQNNRLKRYFGTALCALFPLILSLLVINPVMAAPVDKAAAKELAETFFATTPGMRVGNASSTLTLTGVILSNGSEQPALQYVKSTKNESPEALIYIFERGVGNGFVLIAGDDRFEPYVAYSTEGRFTLEGAPEHVRNFFALYTARMEQLLARGDNALRGLHDRTLRTQALLQQKGAAKTANLKAEVRPLLRNIMWNQTSPWNNLCPEIDGKSAPVGCVATALCQIMLFHKWPLRGVGTHTYIEGRHVSHTVDFYKEAYRWERMLPNTTNVSASASEAYEMARLSYHVGVACDMDYSPKGSGALTVNAYRGLIENLAYSPEARYLQRENFTKEGWTELILGELSAGRPVYYAGTGKEGGHAFVFDGYDKDGKIHVNWGWGGTANGYFSMDALDPDELGVGGGSGAFNYNQEALIRIIPDRKGTTDANNGDPFALALKLSVTPEGKLCADSIHIKNIYPQASFRGDVTLALFPLDGSNGENDTYSDLSATLLSNVDVPYSDPDDKTIGHLGKITFDLSPKDGTYCARLVYRDAGKSTWHAMPLVPGKDNLALIRVENGKPEIVSNEAKPAKITAIEESMRNGFPTEEPSFFEMAFENKGSEELFAPFIIYLFKEENAKGKFVMDLQWVRIPPFGKCKVHFDWAPLRMDNPKMIRLHYPGGISDSGEFEYLTLEFTGKDINYTAACPVSPSTEGVRIAPQPADEAVTLYNMKPGTPYRLTDMSGKLFMQGKAEGESVTLSVQALPDGTYLLLTDEAREKVIVRHN